MWQTAFLLARWCNQRRSRLIFQEGTKKHNLPVMLVERGVPEDRVYAELSQRFSLGQGGTR